MIVGTPRPSSPSRQATVSSNSGSLEALDRLPSLSLSRWIRNVLRVAVGQHPRHDEAGQAAGRLGEHQEHVAHRRRGEPLVSGEPVGAVGAGHGAGRVGPDVRAALLLGHAHAGQAAGLALRARAARGRRSRDSEPRLPLGGERRRRPAARAPRRGSSRSGSRGRPRSGSTPRSRPRGRPARPGSGRAMTRRAGPRRPRPSSASATTGGTRPRRCGGRSGRGCAAPAGSRWPAGPTPGPRTAGPPAQRAQPVERPAGAVALRRPRPARVRLKTS